MNAEGRRPDFCPRCSSYVYGPSRDHICPEHDLDLGDGCGRFRARVVDSRYGYNAALGLDCTSYTLIDEAGTTFRLTRNELVNAIVRTNRVSTREVPR